MKRLAVVGKAHEKEAGDRDFSWFIYGSSLDATAFAAWAKEHGYVMPDLARAVPARLDGYRLAFEVMSRFWGGAVASLVADQDAHVEGIALPLPSSARGLVEHKEGVISGLFEPLPVTVRPLAGGEPIAALAFRATAARRMPQPGAPSPTFVETVVRGRRNFGLTAEYLAALEGAVAHR